VPASPLLFPRPPLLGSLMEPELLKRSSLEIDAQIPIVLSSCIVSIFVTIITVSIYVVFQPSFGPETSRSAGNEATGDRSGK
jgi:hypothetical protein